MGQTKFAGTKPPKKPEKMELFLREFDDAGAIQSIACNFVDINYQTVLAWRNTHPEFDAEYKKICAKHGKRVMETVRLHGVEGQMGEGGVLVIQPRLTEMMAELHVPEVRAIKDAKNMVNFNVMIVQMFENYTDALKVALEATIPTACPKCRKEIDIRKNVINAISDLEVTYKTRDKIESVLSGSKEDNQ